MSPTKNKVKLKEQIEGSSNWGLHPELGPEFFRYYFKKAKTLFFHPEGLTKEAYAEYPQTKDKGIWMPSRPTQREASSLLELSVDRKTITIYSNVFRDPRASRALITTSKYLPELNNAKIEYFKRDGQVEFLGILKDVVVKAKTIQGKSPSWTRDREKEQEFQSFKFEVLEEISDVDWFHATSMKHLKSILSTGLKPSKSAAQGEGWTQLNFDLQNAVYLTADKEYAEDIAETLLARFDVPGVVLRIRGSALKDYSRIVVDEDSLRNEIDGSVSGGYLISDLPDFMTSFLDKIESIGYKGVIPPSDLKVETVVATEQKPQDFVEDEWNPWEPEVLLYTWDEWKSEMRQNGMPMESVSSRLKRVLKEALLKEQDAPEPELNIPEPPADDAGADTSGDADIDAEGGLDLDAGGGDTSTGDLGGEPGVGEDGELDTEGGDDMDFGGGMSGGFGGGGGGFDFGGGDDGGDFGGEGEDGAGEEAPEEPEEPTDPVEFAVEEAKKMAEENQNIQQILTVVKSIITDRSITPEQLNSIVQQLQSENDIVLSAVSNRLLMFAKGF